MILGFWMSSTDYLSSSLSGESGNLPSILAWPGPLIFILSGS